MGREFFSHNDLPQLLRDVRCVPERGVLMEVLSQMMQEEGHRPADGGFGRRGPAAVVRTAGRKNRK